MPWVFSLFLLLFIASDSAFANTKISPPQILIKLYPEFRLENFKENEWTFQGKNKTLKLKIIDSEKSKNAFAYTSKSGKQQILITKQLFNTLSADHELAFVIAHEMSHLKLKHYALPNFSSYVLSEQQKRKISEHLQNQELLADNMAVETLKSAGY